MPTSTGPVAKRDNLASTEAALADYDAAIARNPDYVEAYNNRGIVKRDLGQYEAALADYDAKPLLGDARLCRIL